MDFDILICILVYKFGYVGTQTYALKSGAAVCELQLFFFNAKESI